MNISRGGFSIGVVPPKTKEKISFLQYIKNLPTLKLNEWIRVDPVHCHQRLPQNTLISHIRVVSTDRVWTESLCKFKIEELDFFFDHEIDHLPGMLLVNAFRQDALVLAHVVYGAPMNFVALLHWMDIKIFNYGELNTPTIVRYKLVSFKKTLNRMELVLEGLIIQEDYPVMGVKGKCVMLSPKLGVEIRHTKRKENVKGFSVSVNLLPGIGS